ncbi:MAG: class III extradiol ring-cleavage dioxygenase [Burkholderiales bacterium]
MDLPSLFVSHGSPMIALEPGAAGAFLQRLGPAIDATFGRPRAVLVISAHTTAREPVLLAAAQHDTVHDFGGFPDALYALRYDTAGAPVLAENVESRLAAAGITAPRVDRGGLDHGIWTVLRFLYPQADVPVLPLALVPAMPPAKLFALGEALAALRAEGVLVLGSGSITHNLRLVSSARPQRASSRHGADTADSDELPESLAFRTWFAERSAARDWDALFDYRARAPHAALMHPTEEHLLPWYPAAGAGGRSPTPLRLYEGVTLSSLGMDTYAFGDSAAALNASLH